MATGDPEALVVNIDLGSGHVATVDDEDASILRGTKWGAVVVTDRHVYAASKQRGLLHRAVLRITDPFVVVDHINGDTLDCRRSNLRVATRTQNQGNRRRNRNGSSRFKGVGWHTGARKWRARMTDAGMTVELGLFSDEEEAARAYDRVARVKFGEFAAVNFPSGDERSALE